MNPLLSVAIVSAGSYTLYNKVPFVQTLLAKIPFIGSIPFIDVLLIGGIAVLLFILLAKIF